MPSITRWKKLRIIIWRKTGNRCVFCGESSPKEQRSLDHIIPFSWGGEDYFSNLAPACRDCNTKRGCYFPPSDLAHPDLIQYLKRKENILLGKKNPKKDKKPVIVLTKKKKGDLGLIFP